MFHNNPQPGKGGAAFRQIGSRGKSNKCWWMQSSPLSGRWKKKGYALGYRELTVFHLSVILDGAARRSATSSKTAWSIRQSRGISALPARTTQFIRKSSSGTAARDLMRRIFPICLNGSTVVKVLPKTVRRSDLPCQNPLLKKGTEQSRQKMLRQEAQDSVFNFTIVTGLAHWDGSID